MLRATLLLATIFSMLLALSGPSAAWAQVDSEQSDPVAQEPSEPNSAEAQNGQEPSAQELAAAAAWREVQGKYPGPQDRTREAFDKYLDQLFQAIESFAAEHRGTAASFEARHEMALMMIHARQQIDAGLARMAAIYADSKSYRGVSPEGMRLDLGHYLFVYALALSDQGRYDTAEKLLQPLAKEQSPEGDQARGLLSRIKMGKKLQIGMPMPAFGGPRLSDGRPIALTDYRGQVVLVQFWATWCRPCTQEMPFVLEAYAQLHEQGFSIIGISLDDDRREGRQRLLSYTKEQGLPWPQLYDGKAWESVLAQKFQVRAIPANFLLDRNGIIRKRDLRGRELMDAVKALLPKLESESESEPPKGDKD